MSSGVVQILADLIRIASPSAVSNRPMIEYASSLLVSAGWHTKELPYIDGSGVEKVNLLAAPAHQNLEQKEVALACVCHTDTVPYSAMWERALAPYEKDGYLHGCGACDVKGFLACLLAVVSEVDATLIGQEVRILLTADEEVGCVGARRVIDADLIRPRRMVIGEPTSLRPAVAGKGYALAEVTVRGVEAHSALPDQGVSAIYAAARLIAAIEDYSVELMNERNEIFKPAFTTLNIGVIEGGTAKNIIAGSCRFLVEWRSIASRDPDAMIDRLRRMAAALEKGTRIRVEVEVLRQQAGFASDVSDPLVKLATAFCATTPTSIAFGSEASLFAAKGREIIVFGPGNMDFAHSDRERVPTAELQTTVALLATLFRSSFQT